MIVRDLRESAGSWFPETPPVAARTLPLLPARPDTPRRHGVPRRTLVVALVALVFAGTALAASLFDFVPGVHLQPVERLPELGYTYPPFGRETTLEGAQRGLPFELGVPADLGEPDRVLVDRDPHGARVVTLVYGEGSSPRLVLTQWLASYVLFDKLLTHETVAEFVDVFGAEGVWIEGGDHAVFYLGRSGAEGRVGGYVTGNVLVWHRGHVSYRLEAGVSRARALELAGSLQPVPRR